MFTIRYPHTFTAKAAASIVDGIRFIVGVALWAMRLGAGIPARATTAHVLALRNCLQVGGPHAIRMAAALFNVVPHEAVGRFALEVLMGQYRPAIHAKAAVAKLIQRTQEQRAAVCTARINLRPKGSVALLRGIFTGRRDITPSGVVRPAVSSCAVAFCFLAA